MKTTSHSYFCALTFTVLFYKELLIGKYWVIMAAFLPDDDPLGLTKPICRPDCNLVSGNSTEFWKPLV